MLGVIVVVLPLIAAVAVAARVVRSDAAVARTVVGAIVLALPAAALTATVGGDRFGGTVALAIAAIAAIVAGYAARALHGGSIAYARFFGVLALAVAGACAIALARDLRVLAVAWIATGLCTSALLASANARPAARRWAVRHLAIERAGDVAWIVVLAVAGNAYGTFDLERLAHAVAPGAAATALALALVVAGAARSAIVPFHRWLPDSMETPTPVSAFMHAGLVNGAGLLLAKTAFVLVAAPAALAVAALLGAATAATGATIALVRPESKRRLGWSTVAQMGFMLLQCGCGAFAAAVVHLIFHGGYKSTAFLGVAGSLDVQTRARRSATRPTAMHPLLVTAYSFGAPTLGVLAAFASLRSGLTALPAAAVVVALAWAMAVSAARRSAEGALDAPARAVVFAGIAASVAVYLAAVTGLDAWFGGAIPRITFAPAADAVACAALVAGCAVGAGLRARGTDAFYTLALVEGRSVPIGSAT